MGFRINTNIISLKTQRNLQNSNVALNRALERLASGSRINKAGDDAAGLAVSEGLRSQIRGLQQAVRNANDGVGFLQTAEGALAESTNIVQRIRELAIQASNGAISNSDRANLNNEVTALVAEFDRIATATDYNGVNLLDGSFTTKDLQVGVRKGQTIQFSIGDARAASVGSLSIRSGAQNSLKGGSDNLVINGVSFTTASSIDDILSSSGNSYSAIAVAKRINSKVSETHVEADVQNTTARTVGVLAISSWVSAGGSGSLSGDNFKINGIPVVGSNITSTNSLIEAINNVSTQSGVKARLQSGSTTGIEFFVADGRNIQIQISCGAIAGVGLTSSFAYAFFGGAYSTNTAGGAALANGSFTGGYLMISLANLTGISSAAITDLSFTLTGAVRLRSAAAITFANASDASVMLGISGISGTLVVTTDATNNLSTITVGTQGKASDALIVVDAVISQLTTLRAKLGAVQNRLDSNANSLSITSENLSAAQSQIRDADMAVEAAELTKNQILQQAGVAVLGQANVSAQSALQLLKF